MNMYQFCFFFLCQFLKQLCFSISNNNNVNICSCNSSSDPSKNIDENGKQSSLEEDSARIIGTRPAISSHVSPIGQNIVIPKKSFY